MVAEHDVQRKQQLAWSGRLGWVLGMLLLLVFVVAACQPVAPDTTAAQRKWPLQRQRPSPWRKQ